MITLEKAKQIRIDLNEALKSIQSKHGLKIEIGTIRCSESEMRMKLTCVESKYIKPIKHITDLDGLIGKTFKLKNTYYTVKSINHSRPSSPIRVVTQKGKGYMIPVDMIEKATEV